MFSLPFSTVLLRRYLGWTAGEEWLLSGLWTVEVIRMTSWSLLTALFGTYNLVSSQFCFCLMLFEYNNKCERVCAYSVMFFSADSVQWGSKTGVDHCRSCQQGFCCSGICLTFCPTHLHIVNFSTFQVRRHLVQTSHVEQLLCYRLWTVEAILWPVGTCGGTCPSTLENLVM